MKIIIFGKNSTALIFYRIFAIILLYSMIDRYLTDRNQNSRAAGSFIILIYIYIVYNIVYEPQVF